MRKSVIYKGHQVFLGHWNQGYYDWLYM